MSFTGMDIQAVRCLGGQMNQAACEIQQIEQRLTSLLQNAGWIGPDREHFVSTWQSVSTVQLNQVVNALHEASTCASRNATEQEEISNRV